MGAYRTSSAGGGTTGTGNRSITITPAVNDLLIVGVQWSANSATNPTCTDDNGGTYDLICTALNNGSADIFALFVRKALMPNTTSTVITPVVGSGTNTAGEIIVVHVTGVTNLGAGAVRQWAKQENQTSGVPTPVLNASADTNNMTLTWCGSSTTAGCVPNASWTERQDASQASPTTALEVATRDSGFTGTSAAYVSVASSVWNAVIMELNDGPDFDDDAYIAPLFTSTFVPVFAAAAMATWTLASAIAVNNISTQPDEAPAPPEEYYCLNLVPPVQQTYYRNLNFNPEADEYRPLPASAEDYCLFNIVWGERWGAQPSPYVVDSDVIIPKLDEDYVLTSPPVQPYWRQVSYLPDSDEVTPKLDEDYVLARPFEQPYWRPVSYLPDAGEIAFAEAPSFVPDEDYVLPGPPQPRITTLALYYGDDAVGTTGPPLGVDEDYCFNLKPPDLWYENIQVGMGSDDAVGILTEEYDTGGLGFGLIKPVLLTYRRPDYWIQEQNEPSGSLAPLVNEEYALNLVVPVQATFWRHPLLAQDIEDAPFLTGMLEENYYLQPVPPVLLEYKRPVSYRIDPQEDYVPLPPAITFDEEWGVNLVPPVTAKLIIPPYWIFVDQSPDLVGQLEEDYCLNLVRPVQASFLLPPYAIFEQNESPTLSIPLDEDYCFSPVAPTQLTYRVPEPWLFVDQNPNFIAHVTGIIENLAGQGIPGFVKFRLQNFGNAVPRVIPTGSVARREYKVQADNNGYFSITLWGNDKITPAGTIYEVTVYNQYGTRMSARDFNITGTNFDLTTATPL